MKISIAIPSFNCLKTIEKSFPLIIENTPEADEIVICDDASTEPVIPFIQKLQKDYPKIKLLQNSQNSGFSVSCNRAAKAATGDLIVLLNNDIFPKKDYLKASLKHFQDPQVFGVSFAEEGHENWARIYWSEGYIQHQPGINDGKTHITAWLSGGSSIVRREYFQSLGGFDEIYSPAYFEDLDLGYRAWKSGYKLLWEPDSVVVHNHGTSYNKLPKSFISYVKERNHLLTVLRNIEDPKLKNQNKWAQIGRVVLGPNYIKIIRAAYLQLKKYPAPIITPKLTDEEIFALFK